ncbi:MAG: hypothetical protein ACJ79K_13780, partial [Gemmatimonadaceae bacterium]
IGDARELDVIHVAIGEKNASGGHGYKIRGDARCTTGAMHDARQGRCTMHEDTMHGDDTAMNDA